MQTASLDQSRAPAPQVLLLTLPASTSPHLLVLTSPASQSPHLFASPDRLLALCPQGTVNVDDFLAWWASAKHGEHMLV